MANLQYSVKKIDDVSIVSISGSLDAATAPVLDKKLLGEIEKSPRVILVNMGNLEYIASAGLGTLINANEILTARGSALRLCCLNEKVKKIFKLLGFLELFTIYESEEEAMD